jgi:C-terminal processing protease CtpA/Prc
MPKYFRIWIPFLIAVVSASTLGNARPAQQSISKLDLERTRGMLRDAYDLVKKNYYDVKFHGLDWDARFRQFDEQMMSANSLSQGFAIVADFLSGLNDSHTFFSPPARTFRVEYGYRLQLVGNNTFISRVRPGTDAEAKVHPGDEVLSLNRIRIARSSFWQMNYALDVISPQAATNLALRDPAGSVREAAVTSKMQQLKKVMDLTSSNGGVDLWNLIREGENIDHVVRQRYVESGDVMIWKMPEFDLDINGVDHMFGIARKHKTLILDLRGNPGGYVDTLARMVGNVFDHDITIATRVGRKPMKPQLAKSVGGNAFSGKIIVLIDSESASAAELFARLMQLEHRGTVIGDSSSGSVMEAKGYSSSQGMDIKIFYSFSITDADVIMSDGKSLEHNGVTPDEILLPTPQDIAGGRDPVLAHAADLAGLQLDPSAAGRMFPFEWLPF